MAVLVVALAGCAGLQAPPVPQSPSQALAVAETEYAALKRAAADLALAGGLQGARLEKMAALFEEGDKVRELARTAWDLGDMRETDTQVAALLTVLLRLREEVNR